MESLLGPLASLTSSLTWAIGSAVYARLALRFGGLNVNFTRALLIFPLFVLSSLIFDNPRALLAELPAWRLGWLGLSMFCSYGFGDVVFFQATTRLGTPTALAIASSYPLWAALFGVVWLGEPLSPMRICGVLLCLLGVSWLVLLAGSAAAEQTEQRRARRQWLLGLLLAFFTSLLWAGNTYSIRRGAMGLPFLFANSLRYGMAVAFLFCLRFVTQRPGAKPSLLRSPSDLRSLGPAAFVEAFIGSSIFVYGLSHAPLGVAATLSSLAPLFAVPVGLVLKTERVNLRRVAAITLTVLGVVLLVR